MAVGIYARGGIGLPIPVIRIASGYLVRGVVISADIQMEGVGTWATAGVHIVIGIDSAFGVLSSVPCVRITCILAVAVVRSVIDGEV